MIFAHGPAGFLLTWLLVRSRRLKRVVGARRWWLMIVGFVGGIFPDIDLFFYYFVDASRSHRQFFTHTPILYIGGFLLLALVFYVIKRRQWIIWLVAFGVGALSHLVTDAILAQVMFLYPLSTDFFGLADIALPGFVERLFFIGFLVEGIFCFFFFYVLIWELTKTPAQRRAWTGVLAVVFLFGVATLTYIDARTYHTNFEFYYDDFDGDSIPNFQDRDIDGDGQLNIDDLDSNGDGESNPLEITTHAEGFIGALYDPTDGGLGQIPARLGLVTNRDITRRLYAIVGMSLREEFAFDYASNPAGYELTPQDSQFDRSLQNLRTWIEHRGRLETGEAVEAGRDQLGDVLFFQSGHIGIVTAFTNKGQSLVLDVQEHRPVLERLVPDIETNEGPVVARGKMLDASPLFATE